MTIKTSKGSFKMVPEGDVFLNIKSVELMPSGKPQTIIFTYTHENGAELKERMSLTHPVAERILGKRCDILYDGELPEGSDIEVGDLPSLFTGKVAHAHVEHNKVTSEKDGKTRTFANVKYVMSYSDSSVEDEDDDL